MEEGGKKLPEIAPEVTKETKEPAFDLAIEVALGYEPTVEERKLLETATDQESLFIERLERTQEDIDAFFNKVEARFDAGKGHPKKIRMALQVMLKIHADQEDRKDTGKSFLSHPIAVASRVLDMTTRYTDFDELADLCVAALLHDSIEDQARLL